MYANIMAPILVVFLFCDELTGSLLTDFISIEHWHCIRLLAVLGAALLRMLSFRDEMQF
jgi:hypothetical protein